MGVEDLADDLLDAVEVGVDLGGTERGGTWLHVAAAGSDAPRAVDLFLRLGLDPNGVDDAGWTPLHYAAAYGYHRVYATLVAAGADPLVRTPHGLGAAVLLQRQARPAVGPGPG